MQFVRTVTDRLLLLLLSAVLAFIALFPLERLGIFGSSFEGSSGYAAIYFGFPILTVIVAVLAVRFAPRPLPLWARIVGWVLLALLFVFGFLF
ncbi:DUF4175 domain-containing protein [Brucella haematophila]|jgi:hypothetical protein|uniref:DUF4175 domain-containing protein n=1 Tax=Brucella haematophila TaxID=419474 RepID=A0ABX1DJ75_9HYPH|nr:DUF4175 domain-containing protein [Brucella haematophila]KAB2698046.1 DUF4175 domain-containing protein [Ochrobactrum sp. Kaboul]NKC03014.1 DUF4175 domain-containing protein [Brucella haematophila]TMV01594.1 DUF4175 domain-containing protein [Brucella haematophila]